MAIDKEKIKDLLGSGLSNEQVADAVGVEGSYIAQLLSNDDFANDVIVLRTKNLTAANARDKKIDGIEDALIDKLATAVDSDMIYKPRDILSSFAVVNAARRRGVPAQAALGAAASIVNLTMPTVVINHFTKNNQGEVIEVVSEDKRQTLVTMPSRQLLEGLIKENKDGDKYKELQKFIPATASP